MKPIPLDVEIINELGAEPLLVTSEDQRHAQDLPAAMTPAGELVSRWRLTDDERQAIAAGADIYLFVRNFGQPVQPVKLVTGDPALDRAVRRPDDTLFRKMGGDRIGGGHGGER
jgi:hypothetical protein